MARKNRLSKEDRRIAHNRNRELIAQLAREDADRFFANQAARETRELAARDAAVAAANAEPVREWERGPDRRAA